MEDDPIGAFSSVPHKILHVDDVWVYIHCETEESGIEDILDLYTDNIMNKIDNPKPKFM